ILRMDVLRLNEVERVKDGELRFAHLQALIDLITLLAQVGGGPVKAAGGGVHLELRPHTALGAIEEDVVWIRAPDAQCLLAEKSGRHAGSTRPVLQRAQPVLEPRLADL